MLQVVVGAPLTPPLAKGGEKMHTRRAAFCVGDSSRGDSVCPRRRPTTCPAGVIQVTVDARDTSYAA